MLRYEEQFVCILCFLLSNRGADPVSVCTGGSKPPELLTTSFTWPQQPDFGNVGGHLPGKLKGCRCPIFLGFSLHLQVPKYLCDSGPKIVAAQKVEKAGKKKRGHGLGVVLQCVQSAPSPSLPGLRVMCSWWSTDSGCPFRTQRMLWGGAERRTHAGML